MASTEARLWPNEFTIEKELSTVANNSMTIDI
jgi:hypothetical protein